MAVQVTAIKKEGKRPWEISVSDGKLYKTFDADVISGLAVGMWIEAVTEISGNKYHDTMLNEWKATDEPANAPAPIAPPASVPPEVWEGKDRAIAMESAYKAAAEALKAITPDKVTAALLQSTAHMIYRDIEKARAGESFEPKKAAQTPASEDVPYSP